MSTTRTAGRLPGLLRAAAGYTAATIVQIALGGAASLASARILGPALTGLWDLLNLIPTYNVSNLGVVNGMQRELPIVRGRGDGPGATAVIRDQALLAAIVPTLILAAAFCLMQITLDISASLHLALALYSLAIVALQLNGVLFVLARSMGRFHVATINTLIYAALLVLPPALALVMGFTGQAAGTALYASLSLIALLVMLGIRRLPRADPAVMRRLLVTGFPIMTLAFVQVLLFTGERGIIATQMGAEALGTFRIATLTAWAIYFIAEIGNQIVYPTLGEEYGARGITAVRSVIDVVLRPMAFVTPAVAGLAWLAIPSVTLLVLPQFSAGIAPAQLMALAVTGLVLASIPGVALLVLHRERRFLALSAVALAIKLVGASVAIGVGAGLVGIVTADAVAYFTLFALAYYTVQRVLDTSIADVARGALALLWPILAAVVIVTLASVAASMLVGGRGLAELLAGSVLFLVAYAAIGLLTDDVQILRDVVRLGVRVRS